MGQNIKSKENLKQNKEFLKGIDDSKTTDQKGFVLLLDRGAAPQ